MGIIALLLLIFLASIFVSSVITGAKAGWAYGQQFKRHTRKVQEDNSGMKRTIIKEGTIKKNTNPPPATERPTAPKSQVALQK